MKVIATCAEDILYDMSVLESIVDTVVVALKVCQQMVRDDRVCLITLRNVPRVL